MKICIAFTPMPARENPNINSKSDRKSINSYYEAMVVEFFSLRKFNPQTALVLVTTHEPPARYLAILRYLGVSIKLIPFAHRPPDGYASQFVGCFYLLDAICAEENEDCLYLDPDVICLKSILPIQHSNSVVKAFELDVTENTVVSGLSIRESYKISNEIFGTSIGIIPEYKFYGGEFYFIPKSKRKNCINLVEKLYQESLHRFRQGSNYFPTEEHLLSAVFSRLEVVSANDIISRVWTAPSHRNVNGGEMDKILLHFPAEKEWGFRKTYKKISMMRNPLKDFSNLDFLSFVEQKFQLKKRSITRITSRIIAKTIQPFYVIVLWIRLKKSSTFLQKNSKHRRDSEN